jgi:hypothetical protein
MPLSCFLCTSSTSLSTIRCGFQRLTTSIVSQKPMLATALAFILTVMVPSIVLLVSSKMVLLGIQMIPGTDEYRFNFWGYSTVNFFSPMARYSQVAPAAPPSEVLLLSC